MSNSNFKKKRLEEKQDSLRADWELISKKLKQLKQDLIIQSGTAVKFQLEQEIKIEEIRQKKIESELDAIEKEIDDQKLLSKRQELLEDSPKEELSKQSLNCLPNITSNTESVAETSENLSKNQSIKDSLIENSDVNIAQSESGQINQNHQNARVINNYYKSLKGKILQQSEPEYSPQSTNLTKFFRLASSNRIATGLFSSLAITSLIMLARSLGAFQSLELAAFDKLMAIRPPEGIDSRIIVVEATEDDINRYKYPLDDSTLVQLLSKISEFQPRTIGLYMARYEKRGSGRENLIELFNQNQNLLFTCKFSSTDKNDYPPSEFSKKQIEEQVGFSNLLPDGDDKQYVVRRHLMYYPTDSLPNPSPCSTSYSLGVGLSINYLEKESTDVLTFNKNGELKFGKTIFKKLPRHFGGYQNLEPYNQVMINYRSGKQPAPNISLKKVLESKDKSIAGLFKDRIVLISVTAPAGHSYTKTPSGEQPEIWIQAHVISQILSMVQDNRSSIWVLPQWEEFQLGDSFWILLWASLSTVISYSLRSYLKIISLNILSALIIVKIASVAICNGGWLPLIPSLLSLPLASSSICFLKNGNKE